MIFKTGRYTVTLTKWPTLMFLCLLPLLLSLGMWQSNRAIEKRGLIEQQQQAQRMAAIPLTTNADYNAKTMRYRKLKVAGRYDVTHQILIDNQIYQGKAGYFVLTPFVLQNESKAILVNRGWIPSNPDRKDLPDVSMMPENMIIAGRANHFPSVGIKLAGAEIPTDTNPWIVQIVDFQILSKKLGYPLFDFQLELDKSQPDGFKREWHTTTLMPPEQHTAYATQWFGLALTLTVLFIVYSFKRSA